jgi:hypothetical protein
MTTPPRITADVRRLCRKLGDVDEPVFISVEARTDCGINDCFIDVEKQVEDSGGSIQHGWLVWEIPGIIIEGEFHAVWRKLDGSLLDVTRKQDGETLVLFVPDRVRRFQGQCVLTIYHAVGRDPRIRKLIEVSSRFQRLFAKRCRGRFGEEIVLDAEMSDLLRRKTLLEAQLIVS